MDKTEIEPLDLVAEVVEAGLFDLRTIRLVAAEAQVDPRTVAAYVLGLNTRLGSRDRIRSAATKLKVDLGDPRVMTGRTETADATRGRS